jgi:hypothetical protein
MIDSLKLLSHDLILHPELHDLLVLLDIHLSAGLLPSLQLCVIVVFEYFGLVVDRPEYLILLLQLSQLFFLVLLDVLQVINRVLIHQRFFIRLNKFIVFIFIFFVIFFFLLPLVGLFD